MKTYCGTRRERNGQKKNSAFDFRGFTLIELLVVVAMIAILSGLLLPVLLQARDKARQRDAQQLSPPFESIPRDISKPELPKGPLPIIDSLSLNMSLASSYHRIGMDVFTRYRVDCTGGVVFRHPDGKGGRVVLTIPFPDNIVEARDVEIKIQRSNSTEFVPLNDVVYNKRGISCTCIMSVSLPLTASV